MSAESLAQYPDVTVHTNECVQYSVNIAEVKEYQTIRTENQSLHNNKIAYCNDMRRFEFPPICMM
jgi:hypothetical protein